MGDWTHALHELVREKGEAREGRLLLASSSQAAAKPAAAGAAATTKPTAAASPTSFSVVAAASPRDDAVAPDRSAFGGSRDLESQLSAAAAAAAGAGAGLPPLPPAASSLALARGSSLSAPLPLLDAAADPSIGEQHQHHPPLTKRVSFAEERVAALVEEATRKGGGVGCDGQRPASPPPSPPRPPPPRRRRRTRDGDIPYTFSIDGPWGAPTQVSLRFCFSPGRLTFALSLFFLPQLSFLPSNLLLFFPFSLPPSLPSIPPITLGTTRQEFADYDVIVLLGAGIGVTPMASVLRSLAHELAHARCPNCSRVNELLVSERIRHSRVYFHWILPYNEDVKWFSDVLYGIAGADTLGMFDLNLHFTRVDGGSSGGGERKSGAWEANGAATDTNNRSGVAIHKGRPDFHRILVRACFRVFR